MRTLIITASLVLAVLVLGIGALAMFPDPTAGDPVVILQINPAGAPAASDGSQPAPTTQTGGTSESQTEARAPGDFAAPPGFAVAGLPAEAGTNPHQAAASVPEGQAPAADAPAPDLTTAPAPETPLAMQTPAAAAMPTAPDAAPAVPVESEAGPGPLPEVPVAELVEESQYGPLPKVAQDGRRPLDVYARPSRYAARAASGEPARVAVLINGMGLPDSATAEVIKGLPGAVSVAYGVYGRNLQDWVTKARAAGHEVFLQIPLEPQGYPENDPGPHTLLTSLPPEENMKRLQWVMSRFTGYVGVTNHMGGKFEAAQDSFLPVLEELKSRGLLYVDDGNAQRSTAGQIASVLGLDFSVANVQLDAGASPADMAKAFAKLEALAKERGAAIGVAAAKPATIKQLAQWAQQLEAKGIVLVPVSAAVRSQRQS